MRLVLFRPEIAGNVGALVRTAACFGAAVDIVEPCGFPLGDRTFRRAALDYARLAEPTRHASWTRFLASPERASGRLVLLTTRGTVHLWDFRFRESDLLILGQESAGAPDEVRAAADHGLRIPIAEGARSLNVATAGAVALAEARRQLGFPETGVSGSAPFPGDARDP